MLCSKCGKRIGYSEEQNSPTGKHPVYQNAYQVRVGYEENNEFVPIEDIGYYCSECLAKGV